MTDLLHLPPPPAHVLMPTKRQLELVDTIGITAPKLYWTDANCDTCGGSGQFTTWLGLTGDMENIGTFACPCKEQLRLYRFFAHHGLQMSYSRFRLMDMGTWAPDDIRRGWVVNWIKASAEPQKLGFKGATILGGTMRTGKTLAMALVAKSMLLYRVDVQWLNSATLTNQQVSWTKDESIKRWWTKRVRNADVLFIDGFGLQRGNEEYVLSRMHDLLYHRMTAQLPTFIETRLGMDQLGRTFPDLIEMIAEMCPPVSFDSAEMHDLSDINAEKSLGISRPAVFLGVS